MKMEIGAMALCSLGAATAFVAPSAFHGSQLARPQQASTGMSVMSCIELSRSIQVTVYQPLIVWCMHAIPMLP